MRINYILLVAVLLLLATPRTYAEVVDVEPVEFGLQIGGTVPVGGYRGGDAKISSSYGFEIRYNFAHSPMDVGFLLGFDHAKRDLHYVAGEDTKNRTIQLAAVSDYNFGQGKKMNPFAGLAFGYALMDQTGWIQDTNDDFRHGVLVAPRVGVELFHHARITAGVQLGRKGWNHAFLTVGFALGGRPHSR